MLGNISVVTPYCWQMHIRYPGSYCDKQAAFTDMFAVVNYYYRFCRNPNYSLNVLLIQLVKILYSLYYVTWNAIAFCGVWCLFLNIQDYQKLICLIYSLRDNVTDASNN